MVHDICLSDLQHWRSPSPSLKLHLRHLRSFLRLSSTRLHLCSASSLSIHLWRDSSAVPCLATVNTAAVNIAPVSSQIRVFSRCTPGLGLQGHMGALVLVLRAFHAFLHSGYIEFIFPTTDSLVFICRLFEDGHSDGSEVRWFLVVFVAFLQ